MTLSILILTTTTVINLGLAVLILIKGNKGIKNPINTTFVLSVFSLVIWSLFNYLADNSLEIDQALFWTKATFPAALFVTWFILWFSCIFPVKTKNYTKIISSYFIFVLIFSVLSMGKYIIENVSIEKGVGISEISLGVLYPGIVILFLSIIIHSLINFYKKYKRLEGKGRLQIKYVLLGWGIFLSGAVTTNLILPYITNNAIWSKFGPLFSAIMVFSASYAIVRHQLLDIKLVIQRGVIYTALFAIIVGFYLSSVSVIGFILQKTTDTTILLSAGLTILLGIFGVPIIEKYFRKITNKVFFKDKYNYSETLRELSIILNKNINTEHIINKTSITLQKVLKVKDVHFVLINKKNTPDQELNNIENIYIPIVLEKETVGNLVLGKKLSGDPYNDKDLNLLKTFAYQAAVALKKAEMYRELKNYSYTLEEKVNERTKEIQKLQEEQKKSMVDISHNLQTPLTVLKGELDLLQKENPKNTNLLMFEKSIDKVSEFIYKLLRLSKLETENGDSFKKEDVNLTELLNELVEYYEVLSKENDIVIINKISPGIKMKGNRNEIEELVNNLVSNAIKYISNDKKITIGLDETNEQIKLIIEDTGIGIKKENLQDIFKRFYRIKDNTKQETAGTGLGLAICKKIAEKHNGTIKVESSLGKGSKFIVSFN